MSYIENNLETIINQIRHLISIESVSNNTKKVEQALDYVLDLADKMGMRTEKLLDGKIGTVEIGEGEETLGILVHVDVVDEGDREKWICDPFIGVFQDNKIYGRGAIDNKGPIIINLHAMKAAMEENKPFTKKVRMIIGTQEEVEWTDMEIYTKQYEMPDYGYTPDGEYPICNIEKGFVDAVIKFPLKKENDKEIHITKIKGGTASNIVPGQCKIYLSDKQEIEVEGKAVHSSRPEKGENAIILMAEKVKQLGVLGEISDKLKIISERFSDLYGKGLNLESKSEYYNGEYIHKNVITPTLIENDEQYLKITVNVRFSYEFTEEKIIDGIKKFCEEEGAILESYTSLPSVYVSRNEPFLKKLEEAYEQHTKHKNEFSLAYGGSYAKAMKKTVAWGPILPGMEDTCHEENEHIKIDDLITNFKIYHQAIINISKSDEKFL